MAISEKAKKVTAVIYWSYASDSGYLFGIKPDLREAVEAIVHIALENDWSEIIEQPENSEIEEELKA